MPENGIPEVPVQAQPVVEAPRRGRFVKVLAVGALAGAVMLGALEIAESDNSTPSIELATDGSAASAECVNPDTKAVFYADQAPAGSNHFGPAAPEAAFTSEDIAVYNLIERLCSGEANEADPALLTGLGEYFDLADYANPDERDADVQANLADNAVWDVDADALLAEMGTYETELKTISGTYHTLYMIAGARDGRPEIRQSQEHMTDEVVLEFTRVNADGTVTTKLLKLECGYQPVEIVEFPGIPRVPDTPETTTTTRPAPTTTTPTTRRPELQTPASTPIQGPGSGGTPDNDNSPDNNVTTSTTQAPPPTTGTTITPGGPTTTEPVAPTTNTTVIPG